jgi:hypothetical protein
MELSTVVTTVDFGIVRATCQTHEEVYLEHKQSWKRQATNILRKPVNISIIQASVSFFVIFHSEIWLLFPLVCVARTIRCIQQFLSIVLNKVFFVSFSIDWTAAPSCTNRCLCPGGLDWVISWFLTGPPGKRCTSAVHFMNGTTY